MSTRGPFLNISSNVLIGKDVNLYGHINLYGCSIGDYSSIGTFVEIQNDVKIGNKVKIQSHTFICSMVTVEDEVFIGHGVMFTNDRFPTSTNNAGKNHKYPILFIAPQGSTSA